MRKDIKEKLPQWFLEEHGRELILSNDIDSLLSVKLLEQVKPNWKLKHFYDFESGLYSLESAGKIKGSIGVDIAFDKNMMTFDNHVTSDTSEGINQNSINLNNVCAINSGNYFRKYCGSTALLIYSLFDIPLPTTEIGKALLLAIDSTYISYYNPIEKKRPDWLDIHRHWLCDILEFPELFEFEQNCRKEDIKPFAYVNDVKIQVIDEMGDGRYQMYFPLEYRDEVEKHLDISLDIPNEPFRLVREVHAKSGYLNGLHKTDIKSRYNVLSFAMTGKNHCNFSVLIK